MADHVIEQATAPAEGRTASRFMAPWDAEGVAPFPVLRRFSAASPAELRRVPSVLGAHPFAPLLEAQPDPFIAPHAPTPVALDPGTDLADWASLAWCDQRGILAVTTTKIPSDPSLVRLRTLRDFAADWEVAKPSDDPGPVVLDARLIRRVGRPGSLIDARLANANAAVSEHQLVYDEGDPAAFVAEEARRLGPRPFARRTGLALTVAKRAVAGKPISPRNVEQALRGALADRRPHRHLRFGRLRRAGAPAQRNLLLPKPRGPRLPPTPQAANGSRSRRADVLEVRAPDVRRSRRRSRALCRL